MEATKAKIKLATLLDAIAHGEEVVITRRGKPVARLIPHEAAMDRTRAMAAAKCIRNMRMGVTLAGAMIEELVAEGRQ